jgi:hypothetical protein
VVVSRRDGNVGAGVGDAYAETPANEQPHGHRSRDTETTPPWRDPWKGSGDVERVADRDDAVDTSET